MCKRLMVIGLVVSLIFIFPQSVKAITMEEVTTAYVKLSEADKLQYLDSYKEMYELAKYIEGRFRSSEYDELKAKAKVATAKSNLGKIENKGSLFYTEANTALSGLQSCISLPKGSETLSYLTLLKFTLVENLVVGIQDIPNGPVGLVNLEHADLVYYGRGFLPSQPSMTPDYYREQLYRIIISILSPDEYRDYTEISYASSDPVLRQRTVQAINMVILYQYLVQEVIWHGSYEREAKIFEQYDTFVTLLKEQGASDDYINSMRKAYEPVLQSAKTLSAVARREVSLTDKLEQIKSGWITVYNIALQFEAQVNQSLQE